jgi:hypothetical protein
MQTIYEKQPLRVICESGVDVTNATSMIISATDGLEFDEEYDADIYNGDPTKVFCDIDGGELLATDQMIFRSLIYFEDTENPYPGNPKYIAIESLSPPLGIGKPAGGLTLRDYRWALRAFLKDFNENNRLLNFTVESEIEFLDTYIFMALGSLNVIPPILSQYSLATFPVPNLLIHQATMECLMSNSIVFSRNDLTYNNGGVTTKIVDGQRYATVIQLLSRMLDNETNMYRQMKIAQNITAAYGGGVSSPYAFLHGRYATLQPNSLFAGR